MTTEQPAIRTARARSESLLLALVHSNLFISLGATSVALSAMVLGNHPVDPVALFVVFAVTLFVYSFNRLADLPEDRQNVPDRAAFTERFGRPLLLLAGLLYLGATAVVVAIGIPGAPAMALPLVVTVLYSVAGAKQVLLVKNLLVGAAWAAIVLGVGVYYNALWTAETLFFAGFIGAMLTIAAVVFDVKDIEGDRAEGVRTVPVVYGPERTRQVAAVATVGVAISTVALVLAGVVGNRYLLVLVLDAYVLGYIPFATPDRTPLFYGFVVDGEHIVLGVLLLLVEFGPSLPSG